MVNIVIVCEIIYEIKNDKREITQSYFGMGEQFQAYCFSRNSKSGGITMKHFSWKGELRRLSSKVLK